MKLLLLGLALAQQAPLDPGTYRFETYDRTARGPVCTETWELRADWTMTVHSGEEVTTARYRFKHDRDGDWLVSAVFATNGKPDCTGTATPHPSGDEHSTYLIPLNGGDIMVCPPPTHTADGTPFTASCYATLTRTSLAK